MEKKTLGKQLRIIMEETRLPNTDIVTEYFNRINTNLHSCAKNGKSAYYLSEREYPELYSDDSTVRNILEDELLGEELFLYFDNNQYKYVITFIFEKVKYLIMEGR